MTSIGQLYTLAAGVELLLRDKVQFWAELCQGCFLSSIPFYFVAWKVSRWLHALCLPVSYLVSL